jgi:hypothetical protein
MEDAVDPNLFASSVMKLETVDALFSSIVSKDCILRSLNIGDNCLRSLDPKLFAMGANCLYLKFALLDKEHMIALLSAINETSALKKLKVNEGSVERLDPDHPDLVPIALNKLEEVDLTHAHLSTQEVSAILRESLNPNSKLKKLWLDRVVEVEDLDASLVLEVGAKIVLSF